MDLVVDGLFGLKFVTWASQYSVKSAAVTQHRNE
jgi:hypothetical protein